jgi:hypothetical protein
MQKDINKMSKLSKNHIRGMAKYDAIECHFERMKLQEEFGNDEVKDRETKFYKWLDKKIK